MTIPIALTIAGSDSGGGAGIQADLKTFSALGVYGASVISALTAQNTKAVTAIHAPPPGFIVAQLDAVLDDLRIDAAKIGMLGGAATITAVAAKLRQKPTIPLVLDPVMVAKSGDVLLAPAAMASLRRELLPLADVITPNLPEAAALLDGPVPEDEVAMAAVVRALHSLGPRAVLLKGGHLSGDESIDLLFDGETLHRFAAPRIATKNSHGTGCTLSAAIAAGLAKGRPLAQAVADAKAYLTRALAAADSLGVGAGHGPVHHFHALWPDEEQAS
ncbi:bifunctional hydroxymethylpyrimidine kinase/phosphomethylpyrimidine kinase [Pelagibius litoralis]|uniref:hydroxymethylpyrimidine kinase n=1 Tax=Pelagibius litoralis TaxID=374515 RepID=A0A967EXA3_9PROT|nr:bifunctional hydroxymethylpyrimidine kinase/phosphomethylpyrimidine kinase [Pelagibius litoralis]NIA68510.1 bifunctional hydroxymethylpyrimidine kinase/phosphomethylpyrimidine kinase [Pelagibius litoralis]